jgi:hypothetical protein
MFTTETLLYENNNQHKKKIMKIIINVKKIRFDNGHFQDWNRRKENYNTYNNTYKVYIVIYLLQKLLFQFEKEYFQNACMTEICLKKV